MLVGSAAESPRVRAVKALVERPCRGMERWRAWARMLEEGVYGSRAELAGGGGAGGSGTLARPQRCPWRSTTSSEAPGRRTRNPCARCSMRRASMPTTSRSRPRGCSASSRSGVAYPAPSWSGEEQGMLIEVELREVTLVGHVRFGRIGPIPVPLEDVVPEPGTPRRSWSRRTACGAVSSRWCWREGRGPWRADSPVVGRTVRKGCRRRSGRRTG